MNLKVQSMKMAAFVSDEQVTSMKNYLNPNRFDTNAAFYDYQNKNLRSMKTIDLKRDEKDHKTQSYESMLNDGNNQLIRPSPARSAPDYQQKNKSLHSMKTIDLKRDKKELKPRSYKPISNGDKNQLKRSSPVRSAPNRLMNYRSNDDRNHKHSTSERGTASKLNSSIAALASKDWSENQLITTQIKDKFANALNKSKFSLNGFSLKSFDSENKQEKSEKRCGRSSLPNTVPSLNRGASLTEMINEIYLDQMNKFRYEVMDASDETNTYDVDICAPKEKSSLNNPYKYATEKSSIHSDYGSSGSLVSVCL